MPTQSRTLVPSRRICLTCALLSALVPVGALAQPEEEQAPSPLIRAHVRLDFENAGEPAQVLGALLMAQGGKPLDDLLSPFGISSADLSGVQVTLDRNQIPTVGARFRSSLPEDAPSRALERIEGIGLPARLDGETVWFSMGGGSLGGWPDPLPLDAARGELARIDLDWPQVMAMAGAQIREQAGAAFEQSTGLTREEARDKPQFARMLKAYDIGEAAAEEIARLSVRAGIEDGDVWLKLEVDPRPGTDLEGVFLRQQDLASDFSFMPGACVLCMAVHVDPRLQAAIQELNAQDILALEWSEEEERFIRDAVKYFGEETGEYSAAGAYLTDGTTQIEFSVQADDPARALALTIDYFTLVFPRMIETTAVETEEARRQIEQMYAQIAERVMPRRLPDGQTSYSILISNEGESPRVTGDVVTTDSGIAVRLESDGQAPAPPKADVLSRRAAAYSDASVLKLDRRPWFLLALIPHRVVTALETRDVPGSDARLLDDPKYAEQIQQITDAYPWQPEDRFLISMWQDGAQLSFELRAPASLLSLLGEGLPGEEEGEHAR